MAKEIDSRHKQKVLEHFERRIKAVRGKSKSRAELIKLYKRFFKVENYRIKMLHRAGGGGLAVAGKRAELLDTVLHNLFSEAWEAVGGEQCGSGKSTHPVTLVAVGGYGRRILNPGSDVDLLFLCSESGNSLSEATVEMIGDILLMLYDIGFQVGHSTRSIKECVQHANNDDLARTAMLDARFVTGDKVLFESLLSRFDKDCIQGREEDYLTVRRTDFLGRHKKYGKTVYLQEPNIKEGCGGMRDYQCIQWVTRVKFGARSLQYLVDQELMSQSDYNAMVQAYDFLLRVRNELHWAERPPTDILTLRLQGVVATGMDYSQDTILRRIEDFMRDYYSHSRSIYMHSTSLMQSFRLLQEEKKMGLISFLARAMSKQEEFDGFVAKNELIYPANDQVFEADPSRLMRLFRHTQRRNLNLSPEIRRLFKINYRLIDRTFRYSTRNRDTFDAILSARGDVGHILRQMHRVGFLGKYLPEFGGLTCLVQHEFFHLYTADEHTLRCIEALDALSESDDSETEFFRKLFRNMEDPFVLYLALILHDTGRAENYRYHTDASTILAARVCSRLQIQGERRKLLLFLVDNHLIFWKTATSKNIDDPETIAEFAAIMQNQVFMEALLLLTYADSKGTSDQAWTSWKQMLMLRLYRSTSAYLKDKRAFGEKLSENTLELRQKVEATFGEEYSAEIEAHFDGMPDRYFLFRGEESVIRHVQLFRRYLESFLHKPGVDSLYPAIGWADFPERSYSQVEICCWDRTHLLAKTAGAISANGINILSADIYTREDNLVLDIFRVCTTKLDPVTSPRVRQRVEKLLYQLLDTALDWTDVGKDIPASDAVTEEIIDTFPTRAFITNESNPKYSVLEIQAIDRLGLLYDIFNTIGQHGFEVASARVVTEKGAAVDTFYLTDALGRKITDFEALERLRLEVETKTRPPIAAP